MNDKNRGSTSLFSRGPFPIPARRRISNQFHRIFSIKAGMRTVCVESPLEADAIYWAESDPEIVELCEQPLRIQRPIGNRPYFTFDLSVRRVSGSEFFYEIKPEDNLKRRSDGTLKPKHWASIEDICIANAYTCKVLTDKDINKKSMEIANWRRLLPFARFAYENADPSFDEEILGVINGLDKSTIALVAAQLPNFAHEKTVCHIAKLIHEGKLSSNIDSVRLTGMTELHVLKDG